MIDSSSPCLNGQGPNRQAPGEWPNRQAPGEVEIVKPLVIQVAVEAPEHRWLGSILFWAIVLIVLL